MGRKPKITRAGLLEFAEDIVNNEGPQALTIDALAKAAGVSKGGVQYSFASKDELITALIDRWNEQFDALMGDKADAGPIEFVKSYINALRSPHGVLEAKGAGLMINYLLNPKNRIALMEWYQDMLGKFDGSPEGRRARIAFLATEGLMMMRMSGIDDQAQWTAILDDIEQMIDLR